MYRGFGLGLGVGEAKVRYEMEYFFENDDESSDLVRFMVFSGH